MFPLSAEGVTLPTISRLTGKSTSKTVWTRPIFETAHQLHLTNPCMVHIIIDPTKQAIVVEMGLRICAA